MNYVHKHQHVHHMQGKKRKWTLDHYHEHWHDDDGVHSDYEHNHAPLFDLDHHHDPETHETF